MVAQGHKASGWGRVFWFGRAKKVATPRPSIAMPVSAEAEPEGLQSKARLLSAILSSPVCRGELVHYLEGEFASESVAFWEAVETFKGFDEGEVETLCDSVDYFEVC